MKITIKELKELIREAMAYDGPEAEQRIINEEDPLLKRIEDLEIRVQELEGHQKPKWADVPDEPMGPGHSKDIPTW